MSEPLLTLTYVQDGVERIAHESDPCVRICVQNGDHSHTVTVQALQNVTLSEYREDRITRLDPKDLFFLNGYQSWTDTRERTINETERDVRRLPGFLVSRFGLDRYGDSSVYAYGRNLLHGYDLFYAKGRAPVYMLNLNTDTAFLIFEIRKDETSLSVRSLVRGLSLRAGEECTVCRYASYPDEASFLEFFAELYPERNPEKLFGYTSWYNYYQKIDASILNRDLDALDSRFNLFQIDDGYETAVGDWMSVDPVKFPEGLAPVLKRIHESGKKAGIWLAPLVAEQTSALYRCHPDWLRRDKKGDPVKCGGNWSGFYALDLDNEAACTYIRDCLSHYAEMGFDFFKLDFLYAASLPEYDGRTGCMMAERAYAMLRDALPGKLILGCGGTLFNAAGKFDYMRIGPDVSLIFDDAFYMRCMHRERISTKVTLQNTVYRSLFNRRLFGNDPDVFLLRDTNIKLSFEQRRALITINALFGNLMMTSDNVAEYGDRESALLDEALTLYRQASVVDYARDRDLIRIRYQLGGETRSLTYHTGKGVLL